jgi:PAS domain S-box-containing protein
VLLVDDSAPQRAINQRRLEDAHFHVIPVASAEEALAALGKAKADVVVSDVLMPHIDGFELCSKVRAFDATTHIPVVLVSGYRDDADILHAKEAGANALVARGPQADELINAIFEAVAAGSSPLPTEALGGVKEANSQRLIRKLEGYAVGKQAAEDELQASESRFHQLLDAVTDYAIFMLDPTGHIATWNSGARNNKGYESHEIIGQHFSVFYTAEDRAARKPDGFLERVRREGRFEDESWRVRKDGTRFWANVVITSLRGPNGDITGFAEVTRDLTKKRAAEEVEKELLREQLARAAADAAREEMELASRLKDDFLATMSHELRTPLNAVMGWAALLQEKPRDHKQLEHGLLVIERNAKALTRLVGDLFDVSRIITGKLQLLLAKIEILPLLVAAAEVVRPAAEGKGVHLVIDVDADIGATMADADRIQQVVWNLLTNAVRFTPRGGRVTITAERANSGITISVRDTGAGIAAEHLAHVFERFKQVDSSTTRAHGGLGLGLSIVRHLVEAHGGVAEVHSAGLGEGAEFTVTLPIRALNSDRPMPDPRRDGAATAETDPTGIAKVGSSIQDVRVLVVDDDPDSLEVLRYVLERAGAHVTTATNAEEAFSRIDAAAFDLIVSDIGMPETDGYALIRRVRSRDSTAQIPAIALTAYARPSDAQAATRAGYQQHLVKPVDELLLLNAVKRWHSVQAEPA